MKQTDEEGRKGSDERTRVAFYVERMFHGIFQTKKKKKKEK